MTSTPPNLASLVDDMLQDAGCGQDAALRNALLSLGTLSSLPVPAPTGRLAALLETGAPAQAEKPASGEAEAVQPSDQRSGEPAGQAKDELARRRRRHRPTALGLVVVAGMGLGVGGVAASSTAPGNSPIEHLLEDWAPWKGPAEAPAAGPGYRAPSVEAAGELTDTASTAAPGLAADAANAARFLRPAGLSGRAAVPPCAGPVKHDGGNGSAACGTGATSAAAVGNESGSKDSVRPPAAEGTPAGQGPLGAGKADAPASNTPGGPGTTGAAAQKSGGAQGTSQSAPGQGQSQGQSVGQSSGEGQGNGQKGPSQAK